MSNEGDNVKYILMGTNAIIEEFGGRTWLGVSIEIIEEVSIPFYLFETIMWYYIYDKQFTEIWNSI